MSLKGHITKVSRATAEAVARAICEVRMQEIQANALNLKEISKVNGVNVTVKTGDGGERTVQNALGRYVAPGQPLLTDGRVVGG